MKKLTLLLLAAAFLISSLTACSGGDPSGGGSGSASTSAAPGAETTSDRFIADTLPSDLDYKGRKFNFLIGNYAEAYLEDFYAEVENGSLVNDAVFSANRAVEERLGITFNMIVKDFAWGDRLDVWVNPITASILAGDTGWDLVGGYSLAEMMTGGSYFLDLAEVDHLDLEKPWWNQSILDIMPSDKVYFLAGDGTMSMLKHSFCVFFNRSLMNNLGIKENLYETVNAGTWTLDHIEALIKGSYSDVDGNGAADYLDRWGVTFGDTNKYRGFTSGNDVKMYEKAADGYKMTIGDARSVNVFERMYSYVNENPDVLPGLGNNPHESLVSTGSINYASKAFAEGRALFGYAIICDAGALFAENNFDFGMVPYPKFDEAQADYYTSAQRFAQLTLPITVPDPDISGAVMEAWSSECYRSVIPVYFETNLKVRYSADNDMAEMFDLLRANTRVEFGTVFFSLLTFQVDNFKSSLAKGAASFATTYAANETAAQAKLDALLEALR